MIWKTVPAVMFCFQTDVLDIVFFTEMLFSVLLVLGISLVPASSKPAGSLHHPHCTRCYFFFCTYVCVCVCVGSLQVDISAVLSFRNVLRMQRKSWMTRTCSPERSEFALSVFGTHVVRYSSFVGQANEVHFVVQMWDLSSTRSLRRVRREVVSPHDALRLLKQPRGDTRSAVRSADYMAQTLRLLKERTHHVHKRSLNATGQTRGVFMAASWLRFNDFGRLELFKVIFKDQPTP